MSERRVRIHSDHTLPKTRRCELLDVARSSAYYQPKPPGERDLMLMRLIDEIHLLWPFYGSRRMRDELADRGHTVNHKHAQRLMRLMGLRALCPRQRTPQVSLYLGDDEQTLISTTAAERWQTTRSNRESPAATNESTRAKPTSRFIGSYPTAL